MKMARLWNWITAYLNNPQMLREREEKSRQYVKDHFGWKISEKVLEEIYGK